MGMQQPSNFILQLWPFHNFLGQKKREKTGTKPLQSHTRPQGYRDCEQTVSKIEMTQSEHEFNP